MCRESMLRNRSWGVSSDIVFLFPLVLLVTACGDGDSQSGTKPPPNGGARQNAIAATGLVSGGTVMRSSRYRLVGSMTPGVADGTVAESPRFVLRSGLVGASQ